MKREEQIKLFANSLGYPEGSFGYELIVKAVKWADSHPHWTPVKEELPKPNIYKEGKTFPLVLVCLNDGCCEDTDAYDTDNKTWCKYGDEVKYWMHLPQPPAPGKED